MVETLETNFADAQKEAYRISQAVNFLHLDTVNVVNGFAIYLCSAVAILTIPSKVVLTLKGSHSDRETQRGCDEVCKYTKLYSKIMYISMMSVPWNLVSQNFVDGILCD